MFTIKNSCNLNRKGADYFRKNADSLHSSIHSASCMSFFWIYCFCFSLSRAKQHYIEVLKDKLVSNLIETQDFMWKQIARNLRTISIEVSNYNEISVSGTTIWSTTILDPMDIVHLILLFCVIYMMTLLHK